MLKFICLAVIFLASLLVQQVGAAELGLPGASLYDQPFRWTEDNGAAVQLSNWRGKEVLISMAYSDCRRVCIATLHRLEQAQALAEKKNLSLDVIVVSLNPKVDTPAVWTSYRKHHDLANRPNWHFLTGTEQSTRKLGDLMGLSFWMDADHVIHDFKILYLDADGRVKKSLDWYHQDIATLF